MCACVCWCMSECALNSQCNEKENNNFQVITSLRYQQKRKNNNKMNATTAENIWHSAQSQCTANNETLQSKKKWLIPCAMNVLLYQCCAFVKRVSRSKCCWFHLNCLHYYTTIDGRAGSSSLNHSVIVNLIHRKVEKITTWTSYYQ